MQLVSILLFFALRAASSPCADFRDLPVPACTVYNRHTVCIAGFQGVTARAWWENARPDVIQLDLKGKLGWEPDHSGAVNMAQGYLERLASPRATTATVTQSYTQVCNPAPHLSFQGFYGIY